MHFYPTNRTYFIPFIFIDKRGAAQLGEFCIVSQAPIKILFSNCNNGTPSELRSRALLCERTQCNPRTPLYLVNREFLLPSYLFLRRFPLFDSSSIYLTPFSIKADITLAASRRLGGCSSITAATRMGKSRVACCELLIRELIKLSQVPHIWFITIKTRPTQFCKRER